MYVCIYYLRNEYQFVTIDWMYALPTFLISTSAISS